MLNLEGIYIASNDRIDAFDIRSGEKFAGKSIGEVYEPEAAFLSEQLDEVITKETPVDFEHEMNTPGAYDIIMTHCTRFILMKSCGPSAVFAVILLNSAGLKKNI